MVICLVVGCAVGGCGFWGVLRAFELFLIDLLVVLYWLGWVGFVLCVFVCCCLFVCLRLLFVLGGCVVGF